MADKQPCSPNSEDVQDETSSSVCPTQKQQSEQPVLRGSSSSSSEPIDIKSQHKVHPLSSNDEPIPLDKIIKTANTMSSIMMAHKIALEDDFKLETGMDMSGPLMSLSPIIGSSSPTSNQHGSGGEPSLHNKVRDIVHEAYWDLFKEELSSQTNENIDERNYALSKQLLSDIRRKMIDLLMLPQHDRIKREIEDRLDTQIIDQLASVHSLNLIDYAKYILGVLSKLCAPVRDENIKELEVTTEIVQLYRGIMTLLELMRLDFANFTLNRFKPHIKAHSQEYEREKFNEIIKQQRSIGIDGLQYTKMWLKRALSKFDETHGVTDQMSAAQDTEEESVRSDVINKVLNSGYCELLEWSSDKQIMYPETLVFDQATFKQLGEQYNVLVIASSVLLTTFSFVNKFKLHNDNDFRATAKTNVITLLTATYDPASSMSIDGPNVNMDSCLNQLKLETIVARLTEDIRRKLESGDKSFVSTFDSQKDLFKRQLLDLQNSNNRVRELSRRRILEFVDTLLTLDVKHQEKKLSYKMAPPINIPLGLNCLSDEITLTMAQLVKIIRYNRKVFFQHYHDIISELLALKS